MFNKKYWLELIKKQSWFEWFMVISFFILMVFFSIADIDKNYNLMINSNWNSGSIAIMGQTLILLSSFLVSMTVLNRVHRMKQELPFLLATSSFTGIGLLMLGYSGFMKEDGWSSSLMGPGMVQLFVFGMSALSGLAKYGESKENVIPAKKKFVCKELIIALVVVISSIGPYFMIFDKFGPANAAGKSINWWDWFGIIGFAFSSAAIVVMVLFRWTWTFIFWTVANIIFVIYYALIPSSVLPLIIISTLFTIVDFYILIRWIKDQKNLKI
ncbi:MAG: nicotinamide mononucleotide transporter [Mycoplasma sp.]|nr:nicotinamide mononucleotide transporter [Mycoplasma sp.]